jgi:hypothetical protein
VIAVVLPILDVKGGGFGTGGLFHTTPAKRMSK